MGKKVYDISNDDIVQRAAKDIDMPAQKVDEAVKAYEEAIPKLVNEIFEKDSEFEKINVFSRVSGAIIEPDENGIAVTPLYPKDLFEEMNSKYSIHVKGEEASAEEKAS